MRRDSPGRTVVRSGAPLLLVSLVVAVLVASGGAAAAAADDDEQALAEKFAPVVRLVHQDVDCGPGEPYQPSDVEMVLDDPSVALRGPWAEGELVKVGPTAEDLGAGLTGYHLDFPGNPLEAGCDYEEWADAVGTEPTTYAHVVDRGGPGQPAGAPVLVLLPVQRLHQQARGRLGDGPARLRRHRRGGGARRDTAGGRVQPARGHRGRRVGRPEAAGRRRHAPGRARGRRLARQLLRLRALPRYVGGAGFRLRRHPHPERRRAAGRQRHPRRPGGGARGRSPGSPSRGGGGSARSRSTTGRPARTPRTAGRTRSRTRRTTAATSATPSRPAGSSAPPPPTSSAPRSPAGPRSSASSPTIPRACS